MLQCFSISQSWQHRLTFDFNFHARVKLPIGPSRKLFAPDQLHQQWRWWLYLRLSGSQSISRVRNICSTSFFIFNQAEGRHSTLELDDDRCLLSRQQSVASPIRGHWPEKQLSVYPNPRRRSAVQLIQYRQTALDDIGSSDVFWRMAPSGGRGNGSSFKPDFSNASKSIGAAVLIPVIPGTGPLSARPTQTPITCLPSNPIDQASLNP